MNFDVECDREDDGRWPAEVPLLPGLLAYGASRDEAMAKAPDLRFACSLSDLSTAKAGRNPFPFPSPPRDTVAFGKARRVLAGGASAGVANRASIRFSPRFEWKRLASFRRW